MVSNLGSAWIASKSNSAITLPLSFTVLNSSRTKPILGSVASPTMPALSIRFLKN